jgi:hypothetical protein
MRVSREDDAVDDIHHRKRPVMVSPAVFIRRR